MTWRLPRTDFKPSRKCLKLPMFLLSCVFSPEPLNLSRIFAVKAFVLHLTTFKNLTYLDDFYIVSFGKSYNIPTAK